MLPCNSLTETGDIPTVPCALAGRDPKWSETKLNTPGIDYVMARPMHPDPTSAANNRPRSPVKQATARPMIQGAYPRCEGCGRQGGGEGLGMV